MRQWAKQVLELHPVRESSLWFPLIGCLLIVIFAASLSHAAPLPDGAVQVATKSDLTGAIKQTPARRAVTSDTLTENEEAIFSAPLPAPMYHDRYRFYHRYDYYRAPSQFEPLLDDGID